MKQTTFIQRAAAALLTIALAATTAWAQTTETVSYIDADGTQKSVTATVLTGDITQSGFELNAYGKPLMPAGWYVVKNSNADGVDASCTKEIKTTGDQGTIHIILADGAEMTVNGGYDYGFNLDTGYPLAIYGQSAGTGRLTVSSSSRAIYSSDDITINGGIVSATSSRYGAIYSSSVTINGGQVTATGGENKVGIHGTTTLGCRKLTDFIKSNGFNGSVTIKSGQTLYDGATAYSGTFYAGHTMTLRPFSSDDLAVNDDNTEYTIKTATGWGLFCDMLAQSDKGVFSGKTVKLGADITVSRMAGSDSHDFCGTFDGQEHTLTFTSTENVNGVAPFSYVSETTPTGGTEVSHPAIRNLNVVADINTTAQYASALVGRMWGTLTIEGCTVGGTIQTSDKYAAGFIAEQNGAASITDCRSSVTINSTVSGDGTHGGFVAAVYSGTVNVTGCLFDGKLLTTNGTTHCAGFVGYGACNITNSLYAPADIGQDETEAGTDESATFARGEASGITIANCYYTSTLGTAQGKQAHSIAAGEDVTLGHDGAATEYSVSGITAYKSGEDFTSGILYDNVLYAGSGDAVSLTLANSSGDAPLGYKNGDYSATGGATLSGSTLTMADEDVTVSFTPGDQLRSTGQAVSVSYINAEGILCDGQDGRPDPASAIALDGTEDVLGEYGEETWYFVGADISYSGKIECYGNLNIILADGYTMTVNNNDGIDGVGYANDILTIYGQTLGTGTLDITANTYGINYGIVVIRGGTVNATGSYQNGIAAYSDITITGGQVTATGTYQDGIYSYGGNITLGCTNASDFIKATSYSPGEGKSVNIADGQTLFDEDGNEYSGDRVDYDDLAGKTLRPYDCRLALSDDADNTADIAAANGKVYNVTLQGRTLYKDGAWNTLCLPFALGDDQAESGHELDGTPLEGATLMTLGNSQACNTSFDPQTGTLNLDFLPATTVEPGVAYIVKWPIPDGMTPDEFAAAYAANPDDYDLKNPVFTGVTVTNDEPADHATTSLDGYVTFVGTYSPAAIYTDPATALYLGSGNTLYWPSATDFELKPFRAYFQLNNGLTCGDPTNPNAARAITLNFGDASESTGIVEITDPTPGPSPAWEGSAAGWYSMDGRKLQAQPTRKGLYIHNGKKVVIK